MTLDVSTDNRAKENYDIRVVDLGELYKTKDTEEIRKIIALHSVLITQHFQKLTIKAKENAIKEASVLLNLTDRDLISEMKKSIEIIKGAFKPAFEVISYNLPDDATIYAVVRNNKLDATESFYMKLENKSLESCLQELINKLNAENHKKTTNNKYISNLKKKISILEQIMQIKLNKI